MDISYMLVFGYFFHYLSLSYHFPVILFFLSSVFFPFHLHIWWVVASPCSLEWPLSIYLTLIAYNVKGTAIQMCRQELHILSRENLRCLSSWVWVTSLSSLFLPISFHSLPMNWDSTEYISTKFSRSTQQLIVSGRYHFLQCIRTSISLLGCVHKSNIARSCGSSTFRLLLREPLQ